MDKKTLVDDAGERRAGGLKRYWPLLLIVAGLLIVLGGFIYDVMFAGIPYQDPTPEMSARYEHHARIASVIRWCGVAVFLIGWVGAIRRFWPLFFLIGGGLLMAGGFGFGVMFADKSNAVQAVRIAVWTGWSGVAVFLVGVVAVVVRRVTRKPGVVPPERKAGDIT